MKEKWIRCLKVEPGKVPKECTLKKSLTTLRVVKENLPKKIEKS